MVDIPTVSAFILAVICTWTFVPALCQSEDRTISVTSIVVEDYSEILLKLAHHNELCLPRCIPLFYNAPNIPFYQNTLMSAARPDQ